MRRASEQLDRAGQAAACRELLRKNSTAVGMRKQDVDKLDDEAVFEFAERLYQKYKYYIDRMERRSRGRL